MRGLECVHLGNDGRPELAVNVTNEPDIARVIATLAKDWEWDSEVGPNVIDDEDGATEWLVLIGARQRPSKAAA